MDIINIQTSPNGKLTTTNPFQPQTSASTKDNKKNLKPLKVQITTSGPKWNFEKKSKKNLFFDK